MLPFSAVMPMDIGQQASISVRAEERYRSGSDIKAFETELDPIFKYDFLWRGGQNHAVAIYTPRFIYQSSFDRRTPPEDLVNPNTLNPADPNDTPFSALHNGGVGIEMVRPRWRLVLYQFAAYGSISTTSLLIQAPWEGFGPPPDPQPIIPSTIGARFTLVFVQTQLFVPIKLSPRTALIPGATYNMFGGADKESRGVIALTSGPGASLALEHAATNHDRLVSTVGAGQVTTTFQDDRDGVAIFRSEATQLWRHYYDSHLSSELMAGGSIGGDSINGFSIFSVGHAAILWDSYPQLRIAPGAAPYGGAPGHGNRLQVGAIAKVAPWIDLFSGDLEQRFVVSTAANYTIDRVTLRGAISQARVINTPNSVAQYQIVLGETGVRYRITPTVFTDVGLRLGFQDFNNAVRFNQLTQMTAFANITYAPLATHF